MRRVFRFIFVVTATALTGGAIGGLAEVFHGSPAPALAFSTAGIIVLFIGFKYIYREDVILFWLLIFPHALSLVCLALVGGLHALNIFFSRTFFASVRYMVLTESLFFWYWVSTKMFKLSRDEELRSSETPSETELRHAQERRDPALDVAERERLYKMLVNMPEAERVALRQKQREWEEKHGKRNR